MYLLASPHYILTIVSSAWSLPHRGRVSLSAISEIQWIAARRKKRIKMEARPRRRFHRDGVSRATRDDKHILAAQLVNVLAVSFDLGE